MWAVWITLCITLVSSVRSQSNITESDYRLPNDVQAQEYRIRVTPDASNGLFSAQVAFTFKVLVDQLECVVLNSHNLNYDYATLRLRDELTKQQVPLLRMELQEDIQRIVIYPEQRLNLGRKYTFSTSYNGIISDDGNGVYRTRYKDANGIDRWMVVTQLRPVYARRLFPCLDEPVFKAVFQLQVRHDPSDYVISNTEILSSRSEGDKVLTIFNQTPLMSTFLVGFLVSDMARVSSGAFSGYAVPGKEAGVIYSTEIGPAMADVMERHVNIRYPLNKTDQVALPFLVPVAMENWALYNFREGNILYFPNIDKTVQKQTAARYSGHEICHSWMGNAVSLRWWDYLWLSEAFAMYYEYYLPGRVEPTWRMMEQMVVDLTQFGLDLDAMSSTPPLTTKLLTPDQIAAKFMGITYFKGPSLIRMAANVLTQDSYVAGFRTFLINNWMSNVEPTELWNTLQSASLQPLPKSLNEIMNAWTETPGYPVITVSRDTTTDNINLNQERFLLDPNDISYNDSLAFWWIPVSYTSKSEQNFGNTLPRIWFPPQTYLRTKLYFPHTDWYLLNVQTTGFFRVNYDDENWRNLIAELTSFPTTIHVLNRAELVDDVLALARSGKLQYSTALDLTRYLVNEYDYIPWATALRDSGLPYLSKILDGSPLQNNFRKFMLTILDGIYTHLGFEEKPGDSHLDKMLRELIVRWSCAVGNKDCVFKSKKYLQALEKGFSPQLSPDVQGTALCTAVSQGDENRWLAVLSLYNRASEINRSKYFTALACTTNPNVISTYLETTINELSAENWGRRFNNFAARAENAGALLDLLARNIDKIDNRFGTANLVSYINAISGNLQTSSQYDQLTAIGNFGPDVSTAKSTVLKRIQWLESRSAEFYNYYSYKQ